MSAHFTQNQIIWKNVFMGKRSKSKASTLSIVALWSQDFDAKFLEIFQNAFHNVGIAIKMIGIDSELGKIAQRQEEVDLDMTIYEALAKGFGQKASYVLLPCDYGTFRYMEDDPSLKAFLAQASQYNAQFIGDAGVVHQLIHDRTSERITDWVYDERHMELEEFAQRVAREVLSKDRGEMLH